MLTYFRHSLKSTSPAKQEQARLDVENAEDDLVQKTEVAITLMKTVLENVCQYHSLSYTLPYCLQPEPLKNLNELTKAQVFIPLKKKTFWAYLCSLAALPCSCC